MIRVRVLRWIAARLYARASEIERRKAPPVTPRVGGIPRQFFHQ